MHVKESLAINYKSFINSQTVQSNNTFIYFKWSKILADLWFFPLLKNVTFKNQTTADEAKISLFTWL